LQTFYSSSFLIAAGAYLQGVYRFGVVCPTPIILHHHVSRKQESPLVSLSLPHDHVLLAGTSADVLDVHAAELLNVLDVLARILRQLLPLLQTHRVGLPAGQGHVLDVHGVEYGQVGGETGNLLSVVLVRHGDLDLLEVVENVQLGQVDRVVPVDRVRVLDEDQVEPSAAALAAGGHTELATDLLQFLAELVQLLGRERTRADAGGVGLDDTDGLPDLAGVEVQAGKNATETGVGRGDEWVSAVVNVQHESVGALDEHLNVALDGALDQRNLVNDVGLEALAVAVETLDLVLGVVLENVAVALLVAVGEVAQLLVEAGLVEDVRDTDTAASGLGGVCGTNSLAGCANVRVSEFHLLETVHLGVKVQVDVAAVADQHAVLGGDSVLLQNLDLVEKVGDVNDAAGANEVDAAFSEDTGGYD
jgi:hypothetical protein